MNVKIPEAPKHFSKAAASTRQEATFKPTHSTSKASSAPWRKAGQKETKELLTTADLLLDFDPKLGTSDVASVGDGEGGVGVDRDLGRDREMCSSPRHHSHVQHRMRDLASAEQRLVFIKNLVKEGALTAPQRFSTPEVEAVDATPNVESLVVLHSQSTFAPKPPAEGGGAVVPPTASVNGGIQQQRPRTKVRPSSCFASTAKRFVNTTSSVPPVGHYNVRYTVVDAEGKEHKLPQQQLQAGASRSGSPGLDATFASLHTATLPQSGGPTGEHKKRESLFSAGSGGSDADGKMEGGSEPDRPTGSRTGRPTHSAPPAHPSKPTSAFASRIPQLLSLTPRRPAYRTDATQGVYNEHVLSTTRSPRNTVQMSRGPKSARPPPTVAQCGAHVMYNITSSLNVAARPTHDGRLKGDTSARNVDFGRQVGRDVHISDGLKFSTFANQERDGSAQYDVAGTQSARAPRQSFRDNDPARDGTTIDYADISNVNRQRTKGAVDFRQQVGRKRWGGSQWKKGDQLEEDDPKMVDVHKRSIVFDKMHKPHSQNTVSSCRVDGYDVEMTDHIPAVKLQEGGSHIDHHSTFFRAPSSSGATGGGTATEAVKSAADPDLVHRKVVRSIDLSKLSPRRAVGSAPSSGKHRGELSQRGMKLQDQPRRGPVRQGVWMDHAKAKLTAAQQMLKTTTQEEGVFASADSSSVTPRVKGNPFLGKHLSRKERALMKEPRPVATSARNYTVELNTVKDNAERAMHRASAVEFEKMVSRDKKLGGRMGAEYSERCAPAPGTYNPYPELFGPKSQAHSASPPRGREKSQ